MNSLLVEAACELFMGVIQPTFDMDRKPFLSQQHLGVVMEWAVPDWACETCMSCGI